MGQLVSQVLGKAHNNQHLWVDRLVTFLIGLTVFVLIFRAVVLRSMYVGTSEPVQNQLRDLLTKQVHSIFGISRVSSFPFVQRSPTIAKEPIKEGYSRSFYPFVGWVYLQVFCITFVTATSLTALLLLPAEATSQRTTCTCMSVSSCMCII